MFSKYLGSLLFTLLLVCGGLSTLSFATRSQVRAGEAVEETWTNQFTLDSSANRFYRVDDDVKADLEKGIRFVGSGAVHVRSAAVQITPQQVSWKENRTNYKAPGARMVARVTWEIPADARNGDGGDIHIEFPKLRGIRSFTPSFHSGGYQKTDDGRWVFREATAYHGAVAVALARVLFVLSAGLPLTLLLHSIGWGLRLKREKKARVAELAPPPGAPPLPRVFYPDPIVEWAGWTITVGMFGVIGSLIASFVIFSGYLSTSLDRFMLSIQVVGLLVGLFVAWRIRASVVTVQIDADAIGYAKGRGEPQCITARWSDLRGATMKSRTYKGTTTHWVELVFPDGKTRKIPQSLTDFPTLRDAVFERYALHAR